MHYLKWDTRVNEIAKKLTAFVYQIIPIQSLKTIRSECLKMAYIGFFHASEARRGT